jgi:hypothetical protein
MTKQEAEYISNFLKKSQLKSEDSLLQTFKRITASRKELYQEYNQHFTDLLKLCNSENDTQQKQLDRIIDQDKQIISLIERLYEIREQQAKAGDLVRILSVPNDCRELKEGDTGIISWIAPTSLVYKILWDRQELNQLYKGKTFMWDRFCNLSVSLEVRKELKMILR